MKKENNYYVDERNNKWDMHYESEASARVKSLTLINCTECTGCRNCRECTGCTDCTDCRYCRYCRYCKYCRNCAGCTGCTGCTECTDCRGCTECRYCTNCTDCRECTECTECTGCTGCKNYKENPQRLISPKIGSRNDQTTVYWTNNEDVQVVTGCFRGNLTQFEEAVKERHGENEYAQQYLKLINIINYIINQTL